MKIQQFSSATPSRMTKASAERVSNDLPMDGYTPAEIHNQDIRFNRGLSLAGYFGWDVPTNNLDSQGAQAIRSAATGRNILLAGGAAAGVGLELGLGNGLMDCLGAGVAGAAAGFAVGLAFIAFSRNAALACPEHARAVFNR
ncbi:hypothetical protein JST97_03390 [bacterium]|nr:hypothetical protein [bacterium]